MERVVQLTYLGLVHTFRVDEAEPLSFWRVEVEGYEPYRFPLRVVGDETPEFFLSLAKHFHEESDA